MADFFMGAAFMTVALMGAYHLAARADGRVKQLEQLVLQPVAIPPDKRCGDCDGTGQNLDLSSPAPFCSKCKGTGLADPQRRAPRLAELQNTRVS